MTNQDTVSFERWYFDDFQTERLYSPIGPINVGGFSYIEYDPKFPSLWVIANGRRVLIASTDVDQWGTWVHFQTDFAIAQEWGTRSFMDALIAGLDRLKSVCNFKCTPPTHQVIKTEASA